MAIVLQSMEAGGTGGSLRKNHVSQGCCYYGSVSVVMFPWGQGMSMYAGCQKDTMSMLGPCCSGWTIRSDLKPSLGGAQKAT